MMAQCTPNSLTAGGHQTDCHREPTSTDGSTVASSPVQTTQGAFSGTDLLPTLEPLDGRFHHP